MLTFATVPFEGYFEQSELTPCGMLTQGMFLFLQFSSASAASNLLLPSCILKQFLSAVQAHSYLLAFFSNGEGLCWASLLC